MTSSSELEGADLFAGNVFLERIIEQTPGWLDRYAAKRTMDLLDHQEQRGIAGSLFEIGIYCGKYLSILLRAAARTGDKLVALDTFDYIGLEDFQRDFVKRLAHDHRLENTFAEATVLKGSSGHMSGRQLIAHLGREARFASIDGSHEYDDVLWDLSLADNVLAAGGIIAADDFLHPICLGVTAAIFHYLENNCTLVPFAHVSNKLFLCRPAWADHYRDVLQAAILDDTADTKSIEYRTNLEAGQKNNIEAIFRGYRVLTIRL